MKAQVDYLLILVFFAARRLEELKDKKRQVVSKQDNFMGFCSC